ncbi:MAG TPA: Ig-like domain-containing protein, partial [Kribbella sp.]|nr:Ig-like domain-containing protein [Kribbella sp.]
MVSGSVRKHGLAVVGICVLLLAGTACSDTDAGGNNSSGASTTQSNGTPGASTTPGASSTPSQDPAAANISIVPAKGASSVQPDEPVTVSTSQGKLSDVTLKDDDGDKVDGSFNTDKTRWTSADHLKPSTSYTLSGSAEGTDGGSIPISSTFKTL